MKRSIIIFLCLMPMVALAQEKTGQQSVGPSIDRKGDPVIDPTVNVKELLAASTKRQDDINALNEKYMQAKMDTLSKEIDLENRITMLQSAHNSDIVKLRADNQAALDEKESKRLDAVRAVDQLAVKTESERSGTAITALAKSQELAAETLRSAVQSSAATLATQVDRSNNAIIDRIASLEKAQYTGAGRSGIVDPQLEKLTAVVETLAKSKAQDTGKSEGLSASWAVVVGLGGLLVVLLAVIGFIRKSAVSRN